MVQVYEKSVHVNAGGTKHGVWTINTSLKERKYKNDTIVTSRRVIGPGQHESDDWWS